MGGDTANFLTAKMQVSSVFTFPLHFHCSFCGKRKQVVSHCTFTVAAGARFFHSTISAPPGYPLGSTDWSKPTDFEFLGFGCDHEVLERPEAKNLSKRAQYHQKRQFQRGTWLLRPRNLDSVGFSRSVDTLGTLGAY